jgi:hypothetical protein
MTITRIIDIEALSEDTIQKVRLSDKLHLPTNNVIEIVHQLKNFELGQTMLTIGGLTSTCVDYICHNDTSPTNNPFENWLLSKAPRFKAARERYQITQHILQKLLRSDMVFGVFPCGVIPKVAELDFSALSSLTIVGYDNDIHGLVRAEKTMQPLVDQQKVKLLLLKKNLWVLDDENQHNLILSNRLSALEAEEERVLDLFKRFHRALQPDGFFITSFFTPSPLQNFEQSPWKNLASEDILTEHCIFEDIIGFDSAPKTEEKMIHLLARSGFDVIEIRYDSHNIYPTVLAQKV